MLDNAYHRCSVKEKKQSSDVLEESQVRKREAKYNSKYPSRSVLTKTKLIRKSVASRA